MLIFNSAKADAVSGAIVGTTVTGLSFVHDIYPLLTEIATIACMFVALHGCYTIVWPYIKWIYKYVRKVR